MTAAVVPDGESLREQVAGEIRAWMGRRRISGVRLATMIGRSQAYVSRRLVGDTPFDIDDLQAIASALNVPVVRLISPEISQGNPDSRTLTVTKPRPIAPVIDLFLQVKALRQRQVGVA